jgi:hypothetical protein
MKKAKPFLLILVFSVSITLFGAFVDSDERYPNMWHNIRELIIMTALIFSAVSILYLIYLLLDRLFSKKLQ